MVKMEFSIYIAGFVNFALLIRKCSAFKRSSYFFFPLKVQTIHIFYLYNCMRAIWQKNYKASRQS